MSVAQDSLPQLHGPRIQPIRIRSARMNKMKTMVDDLSKENNEYNNSMRLLLKNTDEVNKANEALKAAIAERKKSLQTILNDISKSSKRLDKAIDERKKANHRLKRYEARRADIKNYGSPEELENALDKLQEEIDQLPSKREEIGEKQEKEEEILNKIQIYQNILDNLNDINQKFANEAKDLLQEADVKNDKLTHPQRMQIELLKKQLERGDNIKNELNLDNSDKDKLTKEAVKSLQVNLQNTHPIMENLDKNLEQPIFNSDTVTESEFCTSRLTSEAYKSPDFATMNQFPVDLANLDNEDEGVMVLEPDFEIEDKKNEVGKIINEEFPYMKKYPEVDPNSIRIRKHRDPKPVNKRKNLIEYEEKIDNDNNVSFVRKPVDLEKLKQTNEDGTVQKIKRPIPYEHFEVEDDGKTKKVRRPKEYNYVEKQNEDGIPVLMKQKVNYDIKEVEDGEGNKKFTRVEIPNTEYREINQNDEKKIEKVEIPYKEADYTCQDGTTRKVKRIDEPINYDYAQVEDTDSFNIVKIPKQYKYEEIENEDGEKIKVRKEVPYEGCEYEEIEDEEGNKNIIKKELPLETFDFVSEGGTEHKVNKPIISKEYEYSEGEDEEGNKTIIKKPKQYTFVNEDSKKVKKVHPLPQEFEYDEIDEYDDSDEKHKKLVKRPLYSYQDVESEGGSTHKVWKRTPPEDEFEYDQIPDEEGNELIVKKPKKYEYREDEAEDGHKRKVRFTPEREQEFEYDEVLDEEGNKTLEKRQVEIETVNVEDADGKVRKVNRPKYEPVYEYEQNDKNEIIKRPKQFKRFLVKSDDGKQRIIRREIPKDDEYDYDEVVDEDNDIIDPNNTKVVKKPKQFEYTTMESEGGTQYSVRRPIKPPIEFEYSASEDENGDPIIVKRPKKFEDAEQELPDGKKRRIRKQVLQPEKYEPELVQYKEGGEVIQQPKQFEDIEVESEGGTKHHVKRPYYPPLLTMSFKEKELEDGSTIISGKPKIMQKYTDEDGNKVTKFVSDDSDEGQYEYNEVEDEDGQPKIERRKKEYQLEEMKTEDGHPIQYKKMIRDPDEEYEYDEVELEDNVPVIKHHKKLPQYVKSTGDDGKPKIVRKLIPMFNKDERETLKLQNDNGKFYNINRKVVENDPFKKMLEVVEGKHELSNSGDEASESNGEEEDKNVEETKDDSEPSYCIPNEDEEIKSRQLPSEDFADSDSLEDNASEGNDTIEALEKNLSKLPQIVISDSDHSLDEQTVSASDEEEVLIPPSSEEEAEINDDIINAYASKPRDISDEPSSEAEEEAASHDDVADQLLTESQALSESEFRKDAMGADLSAISDSSLQPTNITENVSSILQETEALESTNALHSNKLNPSSSLQSDTSFINEAQNNLTIQESGTESILCSTNQQMLSTSLANQSGEEKGLDHTNTHENVLSLQESGTESILCSTNQQMLSTSLSNQSSGDNSFDTKHAPQNESSLQESGTESILGSTNQQMLSTSLSNQSDGDNSFDYRNDPQHASSLQESGTESILGSTNQQILSSSMANQSGEEQDFDHTNIHEHESNLQGTTESFLHSSSHNDRLDSLVDRELTSYEAANIQNQLSIQDSTEGLPSSDVHSNRARPQSAQSIDSYAQPTLPAMESNIQETSTEGFLLKSESIDYNEKKLEKSSSVHSVGSFVEITYKTTSSVSTQTKSSYTLRNPLAIVSEREMYTSKAATSIQTSSSYVQPNKSIEIEPILSIQHNIPSSSSIGINTEEFETLTEGTESHASKFSSKQADTDSNMESYPVLNKNTVFKPTSDASLNVSPQEIDNEPILKSTSETSLNLLPQGSDNQPILKSTSESSFNSTPQESGNQPLLGPIITSEDTTLSSSSSNPKFHNLLYEPKTAPESDGTTNETEFNYSSTETQTFESALLSPLSIEKSFEKDIRKSPIISAIQEPSEVEPLSENEIDFNYIGAIDAGEICQPDHVVVTNAQETQTKESIFSQAIELEKTLDVEDIHSSEEFMESEEVPETDAYAETSSIGAQTAQSFIARMKRSKMEKPSLPKEIEMSFAHEQVDDRDLLETFDMLGETLDDLNRSLNLIAEGFMEPELRDFGTQTDMGAIEYIIAADYDGEIFKVSSESETLPSDGLLESGNILSLGHYIDARLNEEEEDNLEDQLKKEETSKMDDENWCFEEEEEIIERALRLEEDDKLEDIDTVEQQEALEKRINEEEDKLEDKLTREEDAKMISTALADNYYNNLHNEEEEDQLDSLLKDEEDAKLLSEQHFEQEQEDIKERNCIILEQDKDDEMHKLAADKKKKCLKDEEKDKDKEIRDLHNLEEEEDQNDDHNILLQEEDAKLESLENVKQENEDEKCERNEIAKIDSEANIDDSEKEKELSKLEDVLLNSEKRVDEEEEEEILERELKQEEDSKLKDESEFVIPRQIEIEVDEEESYEYSEEVTVIQAQSHSSSGSSIGKPEPPKLWNFMSEYSQIIVDNLLAAIGKPPSKKATTTMTTSTQTNTKLVKQRITKKKYHTIKKKKMVDDPDFDSEEDSESDNDADHNEEEEIKEIETLPPIPSEIIDNYTPGSDDDIYQRRHWSSDNNEEDKSLIEYIIASKYQGRIFDYSEESSEAIKSIMTEKDNEEEELESAIREELSSTHEKDDDSDDDHNTGHIDDKSDNKDKPDQDFDDDRDISKEPSDDESQSDIEAYARREEEIKDEELQCYRNEINKDLAEMKILTEEGDKDKELDQLAKHREHEKIHEEEEIKRKEAHFQEFQEKEENMFGEKNRKHRNAPEFEYEEMSEDDESRIIKKKLVPYIKGPDGKKVRAPHEKVMILEENPITKELFEREVIFENADVESVGGTVRNVRRPVDEDEFEWDVIEQTPDTIEKTMKKFQKVWEVENNDGVETRRRIRKDVTHPEEEFEYEEFEDEYGNKEIQKKKKLFEFADVESEGGTIYHARRRVQEFDFIEFDDDKGAKKILKVPKEFEYIERELDDGRTRMVRRQINKIKPDQLNEVLSRAIDKTKIEYEFEEDVDEELADRSQTEWEYDEIEDEDGSKKFIKKKPQKYEFADVESEGGTVHSNVRRPADDSDDFEYNESTEPDKIVKRKKNYEIDEIESEGGTKKKVRRLLPHDDDFEYDEVRDLESGDTKIIKRKKEFELIDVESEGGSIHKVRKQIPYPDDFEYEEVEDDGSTEKSKVKTITTKEEEADNELETPESEELTVVRKKKPFDFREDEKDDGTSRVVRYEGQHEPVYEYEEADDEESGAKTLVKQEIEFQTVDALCDDGKTRRIRKRVPKQEEGEYSLEYTESGEPKYVKRPTQYVYEDVVGEDGKVRRIKKKVVPEEKLEEVIVTNEDGTTTVKKVPKEPENVEITDVDDNKENTKQPKESDESAEPLENTKDGEKIGASGRVKRRVRRQIKRLIKEGTKKPQEEIEEKKPATSPVKKSQSSKFNRSQSFSYFEPVSPVKTIKPQASNISLNTSRRKPQMQSDGFEQTLNKTHHRHHHRKHKKDHVSALSEYSYSGPEDLEIEFDEDGEFKSRANNRGFARKIWNNAIQRKIDRAQLEVSISDAQYELAVARANTKDVSDQIELTEFEIRQRQPNLEFIRAMVSNFSPMPVMDRQQAVQTTLTGEEIRSMDVRVRDCLETTEAKEIQKENVETLQNYLDNLRRKRKQLVDKYSNIDEEIDQLEQEIQVLRPDGEDDALPPETRNRMKLEKKLYDQKVKNEEIAKKLKTDATQVRKIKGRLEDMKNIVDMLKKKLAEERRNERPDVTQLVRRLNILKKNERAVRERAKLIQMEEDNADQQLDAVSNFVSQDNVDRINMNIQQMKLNIESLKEQVGIRKKSAVRKRKFALTNKNNLDDLEMKRKEINTQLSQLARKEDDLRENIDRVSKAMATKRLRIPKQSQL